MRLHGRVFFIALFFFGAVHLAYAGTVSRVSDVISDSTPGATSTTHTITFTTANAIPSGGHIVITPEARSGSSFDIPAALDYTDIDLATAAATSGPFTDRSLALSASPSDDGVSVVSGANGSITFTLSSGAGIGAGETVMIEIGDNATFGATGDQFITSPSTAGSYHIRIVTTDAGNSQIDFGSTLVAMVAPVGVTAVIPIIEPTRFNGLPTGLLPGATTQVWISLETDVQTSCKYATTSGMDYASMSPSTLFTDANGGTLHYRAEPVATNTVYNFYVRCETPSLIKNSTDFLITFEVGVVPSASSTPPPPPPPPPAPSGPSGGGGGGGLFLQQGQVTLTGSTIPLSTIDILQDGKVVKEDTVSVLGDFSYVFSNLDRGTYTWGVYVKDAGGHTSATYNSTIYLIGGTNNIISPIYLSPTITSATTTVALGDKIELSGFAIPLKNVQVIMNRQGDIFGRIISATTTAVGTGAWKLTLPTDDLSKGTYEIKAQSLIGTKDQSNLSPVIYVGVGENPNPDFKNRSDLNKDGKVNLVDFSILLFNWQTSDAVSDINQDGKVNLTDFSIMLANWTG